MNHFELYELPISLRLEEKALRKKFYALSKQYHPDFFTLESEEKQAEILELSTQVNDGYLILSTFDTRLKYVLELHDIIGEEGKNKLPQSFLMEMMDINEMIMELEFDFDKEKCHKVLEELRELESELKSTIQPIIDGYSFENIKEEELLSLKNYYLKRKYLLRIHENLSKFAPQL